MLLQILDLLIPFRTTIPFAGWGIGLCLLILCFITAYLRFKSIEFILLSILPSFSYLLYAYYQQAIFVQQPHFWLFFIVNLLFYSAIGIITNIIFQRQYAVNQSLKRLCLLLGIMMIFQFGFNFLCLNVNGIDKGIYLSFLTFILILFHLIFAFSLTFSRRNNGLAPIRMTILIHSIASFIYFGVGCFVLSIWIRFYLVFNKSKIPDIRKRINRLMSKFYKTAFKTSYLVNSQVINPQNIDNKAAVIYIANHSSFMDTLSMGFLGDQVIFLVNDWVYNSKLFGKAIRAAGYLSTNQSLESNIELLKARLKEGYSIMIFPEGTRSKSNKLNRFHKGAFWLAQQTNTDIIPIYMHGNAELLPKGDYLINTNDVNFIIGDRISTQLYNNESITSFTKSVSKQYRSSFANLRLTYEAPNYFVEKLNTSYRYLPNNIINIIAVELKNKVTVYHEIFMKIKDYKSILLQDNHFGLWSFFLKLNKMDFKIDAVIDNLYAKEIAQNNYLNDQYKVDFIVNEDWSVEHQYDVIIFTAAQYQNLQSVVQTKYVIIIGDQLENQINYQSKHQFDGFEMYQL